MHALELRGFLADLFGFVLHVCARSFNNNRITVEWLSNWYSTGSRGIRFIVVMAGTVVPRPSSMVSGVLFERVFDELILSHQSTPPVFCIMFYCCTRFYRALSSGGRYFGLIKQREIFSKRMLPFSSRFPPCKNSQIIGNRRSRCR